MNIICSKEKLIENMSVVLKAVSSKSTLPILECVLMIANENGVKLLSNDLEMGIETAYFNAEIITQGTIALEAKIFSEIVRKMPDGNISITVDSNSITTLKNGRTEFKILGLSGDEFPFLPQVDKEMSIECGAAELKNMIHQTIFSVATIDTKPVLTGELLEVSEDRITMVSLDGFRISVKYVTSSNPIAMPINNIIIPARTLSELMKIIRVDEGEDKKISVYVTKKHVLFDLGYCVLLSRLIEGEFLKYEQVFTDEYTGCITLERSLLLLSLERNMLLSKDQKKTPVKLQINGSNLLITSNTEMGHVSDELTVENEGADLTIGFNPKYLIEVLRVIEEDKIRLQFTSPLSPCVIKAVGNESCKYLVLPLRLKE